MAVLHVRQRPGTLRIQVSEYFVQKRITVAENFTAVIRNLDGWAGMISFGGLVSETWELEAFTSTQSFKITRRTLELRCASPTQESEQNQWCDQIIFHSMEQTHMQRMLSLLQVSVPIRRHFPSIAPHGGGVIKHKHSSVSSKWVCRGD